MPSMEGGRKVSGSDRPLLSSERDGDSTRASRLPAGLARFVEEPRPARKLSSLHKFDKAFPVRIESVEGIANGVGRNIAPEGMFVETRVPCPLATEVRITITAPDKTTFVAIGEVRFQSFLNYAGTSPGESDGLRGFGVRFVRFE